MKQTQAKRSIALIMTIFIMGTILTPPVLSHADESGSNVDQVVDFEPLPEEVRTQSVPLGTSLADLNLPDELKATMYSAPQDTDPVITPEQTEAADDSEGQAAPDNTDTVQQQTSEADTAEGFVWDDIAVIRGVTWESAPLYAKDIPGQYIFTAILPERYNLAEGAALPEILVTVYDGSKTVRSWEWNDPNGYLTEGVLALPGVNAENPVDLATLISMLPASINATLESPAVQDSGEVEDAPISVALQWSSKDFVQAEDGSWPVQGNYQFTATLEDGYTLAQDALPFEITVQLGGAMLLPDNGSVFNKLEICEGSATGNLIVNLLEAESASGDWKLLVGKDYYLNAELTKPQDATHVQIRYGNGNKTYNGVTLANVPGNTYNSGVIQHDYFNELSAYENFTDPTYGSGNTSLALQDGTLVYQIKEKTGTDADKVSFSIGLVVKDEVFDGQDIPDAISVSVGTYNNTTFASTTDATQTVTLKMKPKQSFNTSITASPATAEIGKDGSGIASAACFSNISNEITISALYDKVEFDVTYPLHTELSIGFHNTTFTKVHGIFGTMTVGAPVPVDGGKQKIRITLNHGYKSSGAELKIFIQPKFLAEGGFQPGDKPQITMSTVTVTMGTQELTSATGDKTVTYTLVDSGDDSTILNAKPRTIYNNTIDLGEGATYMVPMGVTQLANMNATSPTPYEKTYEAQFNTSNTAAVISAISVPIGTSKTPVVTWTGISADGTVKSGTVDTPANYLNEKGNWTVSTHLLLLAKDFDILSFTSVKAEIGNIRPKYNLSDGDYTVQYSQLNCASFGYFTTAEPGLVVKSSYHVYNTDPALRDRTNGDLSVETTVTSTDICRMTLAANEVKLGGNKITSSTEVQGGALATLTGTLAPFTRPPRSYVPSYKTQIGTAAFITDPILYLTVPQGMTVEEQDLDFKMLKNPIYGSVTTENLSHTIENVSYLNTTGDNVSIYKITFPDGTPFGYYDVLGNEFKISYTIPLRTSRSLETKRYNVNDLVVVTGRNGFTAVPFQGANSTNVTSVFADKYGLNGGEAVSGIAACADATPTGFNLQQQSEINVYSAVAVTKIGGEAVSENRWYSYSSDPNSIALLGQNSEGRLRLQVSNTSDTPGKNLRIVLPIPQKDADIGNEFMDAASGFTMSMTYDAKESATGFSATYIKMTGSYDSITDRDKLVSYEECSRQDANAVLFTADSVAKGEYYIYLDFVVANGTPKSVDIWRPVYAYSVGTDRRVSNGNYVASEVAASSISGVAFADINRNGRQDEGEDGAAGIMVVARDGKNRTVSTKTVADGSYQFLAIRESTIDISFTLSTEGQKTLRFNVPPLPDGTAGTTSTVIPSADGLSATKTFVATAGEEKVHAAVDGFVSLSYNANGATGNLPKIGSHVKGTSVTVAVKPDNLAKTGYTFKSWNTQADGTGATYRPGTKITISANTTLYAIWELASYTVTFNYRGATGGNDEASRVVAHNATYGDKKNLPTPTKNGYNFDGWVVDVTKPTVKVVDRTPFKLGADTTLYALWTPKTMTVTYDANGDSGTIANKSVSWETSVLPTDEEAAVITKNGYTLSGWTYNGAVVTAADTYGALVVNDTVASINLVAQWQAKGGYTVKYELDGGSVNSSSTIPDKTNVSWTQSGLLPANNPVKDTFSFKGWKCVSDAATGNSTYGALAKTDSTMEITLTAQWETRQNNTVIYDTQGGSAIAEKTNVANDATGLLPTETTKKVGYNLTGWKAGGEVVNVDTVYHTLSSTNTLTLVAQWVAKEYTITYVPGNSTTIPEIKKGWIDSGLLPTEPTRNGYTFDGWYFSGTEVTADATVSALIPADDRIIIPLIAKWNERTYIVQYNSDGGGNFTPKTNVKYTATGLLPDVQPAKLGYTFEGWYHDNTEVKSDTTCGSLLVNDTDTGVTLKAKWEAKTGFTVQYDTDGGTALSPASKTVAWDATNLLPTDATTKTGYTFNGWLSGRKIVTNVTAFSELATSDQPGTSVTLVAQWKVKDRYTVKYDSDGGSAVGDKIGVKWTDAGLFPPTNPSKPGYQLVKWQCGTTDVAPSSTYGEFAVSDTEMQITLKAVWKVEGGYTVKYNTGGGTVISDLTGVKPDDANLLPSQMPQRKGYQFAGWKFGNTTVTNDTVYSTLTTAKELTLTAQWTEKSYTISYDVAGYSSILKKWTESGLLPGSDPEQSGYTFEGWYFGNEKVTASTAVSALIPLDNVDTILLKARWNSTPQEKPHISGTVKDEDGNLVAGAAVKLTQGNGTKYGPVATDTQGEYLLSDLQPGIYNLVAEKGNQIVTVIVTVTDRDLQQNMFLPAKEKNSVLDVKGPDTPAVVVGNLDEIAKDTTLDPWSTSLTIKLTVQKETEQISGKETEHTEIRKTAGTNATILFLDALLTKQVDSSQPVNIGNSNDVVLEVVIPFDLSGKENVHVYRYHDNVNAFRQLTVKPAAALEDQTCYLDKSAGMVHVYAKKYSTYAIAYTTGGGTNPGGSSSGGGGTSSVPVPKPPQQLPTETGVAEWLDWEVHSAYIVGSSDGLLHPEDNITRAEVAAIFYRLMRDDVRARYETGGESFSDVPMTAWYHNAVSTLANAGIISGGPEGTFNPDQPITRGEFAAIAARYSSGTYDGADLFTDISGHWARAEINQAASYGWINGNGDGTFLPDRSITRAEAVTMINHVLCRLPKSADALLPGMKTWPDNQETDKWYYLALQEAANGHTFRRAAEEITETWTALID